MERPILEIKNLQTYFYVDGKVLRAVDGLSYSVGRGECVAVVGESASGKSVSALSVLQLVADPPGRIVGGRSCWMELICSSCLTGNADHSWESNCHGISGAGDSAQSRTDHWPAADRGA